MIIPAIDLRAGKVVRLEQGDFTKQTDFTNSPLQLATSYADAGAAWIHLVDLDAALDPTQRQLVTIAEIAGSTSAQIQTGGGVRTKDDVEALLNAGASRVVVGTAAVTKPDLVKSWATQFGADKFAYAIDISIQDGVQRVMTNGWKTDSGMTLDQVTQLAIENGISNILCTDIARDGMLGGPNTALYSKLANQHPTICWQASGGVSTLADLEGLKTNQAGAAIIGKALLTNQFTISEALQCWQDA